MLSWWLRNPPEIQGKMLNKAAPGFGSFPFSFLTWNCLTGEGGNRGGGQRTGGTPQQDDLPLARSPHFSFLIPQQKSSDKIFQHRQDPHILCSPELRPILFIFRQGHTLWPSCESTVLWPRPMECWQSWQILLGNNLSSLFSNTLFSHPSKSFNSDTYLMNTE